MSTFVRNFTYSKFTRTFCFRNLFWLSKTEYFYSTSTVEKAITQRNSGLWLRFRLIVQAPRLTCRITRPGELSNDRLLRTAALQHEGGSRYVTYFTFCGPLVRIPARKLPGSYEGRGPAEEGGLSEANYSLDTSKKNQGWMEKSCLPWR